MYRIKIMDNIASEGLALFPRQYRVSSGENDLDGIVVRSSRGVLEQYPRLIAVDRAGAGAGVYHSC